VGLAVGILMGLLVELLNRRVRGAEDLSFAARVPVFAVIADHRQPEWRRVLKRLLARRGAGAEQLQPAQ